MSLYIVDHVEDTDLYISFVVTIRQISSKIPCGSISKGFTFLRLSRSTSKQARALICQDCCKSGLSQCIDVYNIFRASCKRVFS